MSKKKSDTLWAKKKEENGRFFWLPLSQHLEDTKNIIGLLWEHWLSEGQKKLIDDSLDSATYDGGLGKRLAQFLAAVHDIGKATPAFQTQRGFANSDDLDIQLLEKLEQSGFTKISSLQLSSPKESHHSLAGQYLLSSYGVQEDISTIIGGHHGRPIDTIEDVKNQGSYLSNYFQNESKESAIHKNWDLVQKEIFNCALDEFGFDSVKELPKIKQPAQVILSGLLIMADWIASNENYFPLLSVNEKEEVDKSRRLQDGFERWKKTSLWQPKYISKPDSLYKERFGFEPNNVQSILSHVITQISKPGIVVLEAPMGLGKTEASLITAEQLATKTGRSGLFFGLPTQATSNGIFNRIEKWVESLKDDSEDILSIQLVHGKAALNEDFLKLKANTFNFDDVENGSVIINEWFSGRKTSALDDFVVGTVDQFLMLALKQKHLALRHLGFSKKVVIIDEVHAYDAYMSQYLMAAIKWMGAYGVPVVILSATLPSQQRENILKSYMSGMGLKWRDIENTDQLKTDAYPLITYNDGSEIHQVTTFNKQNIKDIHIIRLQEEQLLGTVKDGLEGGGVVGIIVNTVRRSQELARNFSEIFGDDMIELLHSSFIATERIQKEKELLQQIGKNVERPHKKVIIGTQVIEQSLDIDFDVMISDLAPMDLLIQRIGRLHRHQIERPQKHEIARFYVLGTSQELDFEEGSSFVYGDYLLARTQHFLPDIMRLPDDISPLVQKVYSPDFTIEFSSQEFQQKYLDAKTEHDVTIKNKETKARTYRINDPVLKISRYRNNSLIGWLKNLHPNDSEEKSNAQVRDVEDTIEVIALKKMSDGYSLFIENQDISQNIDNPSVAKKVAQNTLRLPISLSKGYNIDQTIEELERYNNSYLSQWRNSSWLKGALGIIFDENNEFILNGFKLLYDKKYGITTERLNKNESI